MKQQRKSSGGESFEVSLDGFSARVAMNRPPRLVSIGTPTGTPKKRTEPQSKPQASTDAKARPIPAAASKQPLQEPPKTRPGAAAAGTKLQPQPDTPLQRAPVPETPLLFQASEAGSNEFGDGGTMTMTDDSLSTPPMAARPSAVPSVAADGEESWVYAPPPNNQRSFHFPEDGLYFTSEFDSGNLIQVERVAPMRYALYSCPDCGNSPVQTNNRQWFHFAVRGATKGTVLHMQMVGLMNSKMYSFGWTPVAAVCPTKPIYSRIATKVIVQKLTTAPQTPGYPALQYKPFGTEGIAEGGGGGGGDDGDEGAKKEGAVVAVNIGFEYRFECDVPVDPQLPFGNPQCPAVYIASNHPYSVQRLQRSIAAWRQAADAKHTYFHREILCRTLDGRAIDVLTISGNNGKTDATEPPYFDCIPRSSNDVLEPESLRTLRPNVFPAKKYVLLTARVHPGEAPASHMMQGSIDFLLDPQDPRSAVLLRDYVCVVVPMINPDGVARGHSRADTTGQNLNRMYRHPHPVKHPAIFALRHLMLALARTGRLALYIDMHAHANKKGAFFFGNAMPAIDQVQNLLYTKLVALNSPHFEFTSCNFSESNMFAMGKNGETKDGSSRVTIFQETGFVHSYTIESSYVTGNVQNPVAANPAIPGEEFDIMTGTPSPKYNQSTFADVGKALMVALIDFHGTNPASRIPHGPHRTLRGATMWLQRCMVYEVFEWARKQAAVAKASAAAASGTPTSTFAGVNLETVSPLTLPVSAMAGLDLSGDPITIKGSRDIPPTTMTAFNELLALMKRDQAAASIGGGSSSTSMPSASRSAPPLARGASSQRLGSGAAGGAAGKGTAVGAGNGRRASNVTSSTSRRFS